MKSLEKFFLREEKREGESEEEYKLGSLYINNWSNKQTKNMKKKIKFVKLFASIYYYIYIYIQVEQIDHINIVLLLSSIVEDFSGQPQQYAFIYLFLYFMT